ncbi:hypothetical protein NDU88_000969 [Pleurodeles waltl]|uniref:Uncharacterized protein n=1 Tax=Pleurodeles waltl TaxID=8319 RepID=A0AAV7P2F0_PLEWA|nr:hypothetical protein NDU88_000969 [Pleurodeles waltl]
MAGDVLGFALWGGPGTGKAPAPRWLHPGSGITGEAGSRDRRGPRRRAEGPETSPVQTRGPRHRRSLPSTRQPALLGAEYHRVPQRTPGGYEQHRAQGGLW